MEAALLPEEDGNNTRVLGCARDERKRRLQERCGRKYRPRKGEETEDSERVKGPLGFT